MANIGSIRNGKPLRLYFLAWKMGDEMGRNEVSVFVCNESRWGVMGRNRLSPLEMWSKGGG
jgi:hypothetical protein